MEYSISNSQKILQGTPKSVQTVFNIIIKSKKPIKVNELQELSKLTDRTIRLALNRLYKLQLVKKIPNLEDLRSHFLILSPEIPA
jgi:DNA-binding MarR family transcriptional regulator